jgi:hypothetical protein
MGQSHRLIATGYGVAIFIGEAPFRPFTDNDQQRSPSKKEIDAAAATFRSVCTRGRKPLVPVTERIWVDRVRDTPLHSRSAYRDRHGKLRRRFRRAGRTVRLQRRSAPGFRGGGKPS